MCWVSVLTHDEPSCKPACCCLVGSAAMKTRTMKVLDHPSLLAVAKTPVDEVTSLDLQRGMYDNVGVLSECVNAHSLFLSRNNITAFNVDTRKLWKVDLSHNALTEVGTLANYAALGFVDLSHNDVGPEELAKLRGIHIVCLRTAANPKLAALPHYRASIVWLLPNVWVLDDRFITWREREDAQVHFSLGPGKESPLKKLAGQAGDLVWRSSSDACEAAANLLQSLTQEPMRPPLRDRFRLERLLHIFNDQNALEAQFLQSSAAAGSGFKGRGRDAGHRKSGTANAIVTEADVVVAVAAASAVGSGAAGIRGGVDGGSVGGGIDSGGGGSTGDAGGDGDDADAPSAAGDRVGEDALWNSLDRQRHASAAFLKWTPSTHTEAIGWRRLSAREQVDLVLLLNTVHEFGVPRGLVGQALAVHFGGRLLANVIRDLAHHPECVFLANTFHVRFANIEERDAALGSAEKGRRMRPADAAAAAAAEAERAADEEVQELWQTLDDRAGLETHLQSSTAKPRVGLGLSSLALRRASHAAVLLSRAPAFPSPLLRTAQSKADVHLERCLEPLLHAARLTANELTFAAAAADERAASPQRYVLHNSGSSEQPGAGTGAGTRLGTRSGVLPVAMDAGPESLDMLVVSPNHQPAFAAPRRALKHDASVSRSFGSGGVSSWGGSGGGGRGSSSSSSSSSGGEHATSDVGGGGVGGPSQQQQQQQQQQPEDDEPAAADDFFITGDGVEEADDYSALDDLPVEFFAQQAALEPQQQQQQHQHRGPPVRPTSPRLLASVKLAPEVTGHGGLSTQRLYTKQPVMGEPVEIGFLASGLPHRVLARIKRTDDTALHLLSLDKRAIKVSRVSCTGC